MTRDTKFRHKQFQYDANGRMTRAANLDDTGATTAVYDGVGQRVQTMYAGQPRLMVYDITGQVVAEYGAAESDGGGLRYVFKDQQGSTRAVLDGQGQVTARRDYAPFGEDVGAAGTRAGVAGYNSADETRQQYGFTERDEETGLDHTPWRKYDNSAGRWTSPDPYLGSMNISDPQSFNRYAYVGNDPVNLIWTRQSHMSSFMRLSSHQTIIGIVGLVLSGTTCPASIRRLTLTSWPTARTTEWRIRVTPNLVRL